MKKILLYISFILFSILFTQSYASSNDTIKVQWVIKGIDWTYYNYLNVAIKDDKWIICKWKTRQYFSKIENLTNWFTTDMLKVSDNWLLNFSCDKNKILLNNKIRPNLQLLIYSDWFYTIRNNQIKININSFKIENDRIIVWDFKKLNTNFKVKLDALNDTLFNIYDKKYNKEKEKTIKQIKNKERLKKSISKLIPIKLEINNIPKDVTNIVYQLNNQEYTYNIWWTNFFINNWNIIEKLKIGNVTFNNINTTDNIFSLDYKKWFNSEKIELMISLLNIPKVSKDLYLKIDWENFKYKKWFKYTLNDKQKTNGIDITINTKTLHIKLKKSDKLEIDYNKTIWVKIDLKKIDNNYLLLKLPNSVLDPLWRLSWQELYSNWGNKSIIIPAKEIYKEASNILIKHFKSKSDIIPKSILIKWKEYNIREFSVNYDKFIWNIRN